MRLFKKTHATPRRIAYLLWPLIVLSQLLATSLLAWHLLAQINFAYPLGYTLLGLDQHIAQLAPLNRYKSGFEFTHKQEHWRLFGAITQAVQHGGAGLNEIRYTLPSGQQTPLMHSAELTHLQDVSNVIARFYQAGIAGGLVWAILLALAYGLQLPFPSGRTMVLGVGAGAIALGLIIVTMGPTSVFYWLHTQIFPSGHQWFFYYEESLMTTLMKAPDIFAFIAALLAPLLILIECLSCYAMARLLPQTPALKRSIPDQRPSNNRKTIEHRRTGKNPKT
jgi:hypothetical protein